MSLSSSYFRNRILPAWVDVLNIFVSLVAFFHLHYVVKNNIFCLSFFQKYTPKIKVVLPRERLFI